MTLFKLTAVDEKVMSTSERSFENSPVLQRWVCWESRVSPKGTTEPPQLPFHSSLRDCLP